MEMEIWGVSPIIGMIGKARKEVYTHKALEDGIFSMLIKQPPSANGDSVLWSECRNDPISDIKAWQERMLNYNPPLRPNMPRQVKIKESLYKELCAENNLDYNNSAKETYFGIPFVIDNDMIPEYEFVY